MAQDVLLHGRNTPVIAESAAAARASVSVVVASWLRP